MSTIEFAETQNSVVFLEKPAKVKIVNEDVQIRALIDRKKIIVTEASIKRDLQLQDAKGTACLPNDTIFEELARMSTVASAIICLAKNQKFNFSKYIFDSMVKNLEAGVKLFMFPRFVQVFVNHQIGDMSHHKKIFVTPSFTKKNEEEMFGVDDLGGDEVIMDVTTGENVAQSTKDAKKEVSSADPVTTAEIKSAKPKARGVIVQEPSEFRKTSSSQPSQLSQAKDKGKGIMVEPQKPLKKKDHIAFDEEVARKLKAKMKAEMEEEERIAREKDEANMDIVKEWSKKTQAKVTEASSKRAGDELEQESAKRQKLEKENDYAKLKRCLEIVLEDDDDVTIKATPLSSKYPTIVDYKIYKEGKKSYFKIIMTDGNSQSYLTFRKMFKNFNRDDL
uniref:Uncharacterized protein n=1 Tax=Tanacetum cinerariifolium TaxID=118510 RepID=A0A6L2KWY4_TANCI|nr:hypothetical protein [Tanacetum cinerariifolium]